MLHKKFLGFVAFAVTSISVAIGEAISFMQRKKRTNTAKKALAPEHQTVEQPMCPSCKEARLSPEKGEDACCNGHGLSGLQERGVGVCSSSL